MTKTNEIPYNDNVEINPIVEWSAEFAIEKMDWLRSIGFSPCEIMFLDDNSVCVIEQVFCSSHYEVDGEK